MTDGSRPAAAVALCSQSSENRAGRAGGGDRSTFELFHQERGLAIDLAVGTRYVLGLRRELFSLPRDDENALLDDRMYYPLGLPVLRQALAQRLSRIGLPTVEAEILVTDGAQQAINLIVALYVEREDTVLLEDLTYFGAIETFRATGARVSSMPVGVDGVAPSALKG